jgi:formylglycine-generating enzyme required for sulfatase activity
MKECTICHSCFADHVNHCPFDGHQNIQSLMGDPVLDGRYQLEKRLGQGGMGIVYKAHHVFLKTAHAIKVILPELVGNDPTLATRFRQEAMAAAAIRHPNIISVTDYGVIKGMMPFLVMEFVQGQSLHELLEAEGKLSPQRALEFMMVIASGVSAAHEHGIVHRDLKPLNIMLQDNKPLAEAIKILDFGLAKIKSGELLGSFVLAQTLGMMGSPHYMAPEQWSDGELDQRSDIYSLGIILFQMLAGDVPFKGVSMPTIMKKHLMDPPPHFAELNMDVPPAIEQVVHHALEKDPNKRPATTEEFITELRDAVISSAAMNRTLVVERNADFERVTQPLRTERRTAGQAEIPDIEVTRSSGAEAARYRREEEALRQAEAEKAAEEQRRREEEQRRAEEARRQAEREAQRRAAEEAQRRAAEEAQRQAEEEAARLRAEEERRLRAESERLRLEEEARQRAEAEAAQKRTEEEARRAAEEEVRRRREEEAARQRAQEEQQQAEEAARLAAEAEAQRKAEREARKRAEEEEARRVIEEKAKRLAAEEARQRAEAEAARQRAADEQRRREEEQRRAEEARRQAEREAQRRAAEEAQRRAAEEAQRQAEEEAARLRAEEARRRQEEEARQRAEDEARHTIEAAARQRAAEEARRQAEEEEATRYPKAQEDRFAVTVASDATLEPTPSHQPIEETQRYEGIKRRTTGAESDAQSASDGLEQTRLGGAANLASPAMRPMDTTQLSPSNTVSQRTGSTLPEAQKPWQQFESPTQTSTSSFDLPARKKSFPPIYIVAALLLLLLGGAGIYLWTRPAIDSNPPPNPPPISKPDSGATGTSTVPAREMVLIAGGTFQMGRNGGPVEEAPAHTVPVKPFYIDKTEVTNAQYAEFVQATGYPSPSYKEAPYWKSWVGDKPPAGQEQWPVRNVSAAEAEAYAKWLSKRDGITYRLPTEEEWEYAARDGNSAKLYPWGNQWVDGYANIESDLPKPVGSYNKGATSTGALDLIGNVWEWTSSKASFYPGNGKKVPVDEQGSIVVRGGSYQSKVNDTITATFRAWTTQKHPTIGFRLVRESP